MATPESILREYGIELPSEGPDGVAVKRISAIAIENTTRPVQRNYGALTELVRGGPPAASIVAELGDGRTVRGEWGPRAAGPAHSVGGWFWSRLDESPQAKARACLEELAAVLKKHGFYLSNTDTQCELWLEHRDPDDTDGPDGVDDYLFSAELQPRPAR